ncbi:hypothetical protein DW266_11995 [Blautia sp. AM22-22LB]|nr:hypothetical protein DW177_03375 [Blautia sp. AM16-16B]RHN99987.1 hypothetical protein DW266_11995 [Blautia sp. AM22-22LB]RHR11847.1 hypothetical protein DWX49_17275 [Blautia sp. AF19-34]
MQRVKYATRFLFVFATMRDTLREFLIVIAAVAKVSCKHGLWLVARVKKASPFQITGGTRHLYHLAVPP